MNTHNTDCYLLVDWDHAAGLQAQNGINTLVHVPQHRSVQLSGLQVCD
jgi:phosphotransferase system IIA component